MDSVIGVIKRVLNKTFNRNELFRAAKENKHCEVGKCAFFKAWPIARVIDLQNGTRQLTPILPEELTDEMCTKYECIYIKQTRFKEIIDSVNGVNNEIECNYQAIEIDSALSEEGRYNFVEAVTSGSWFG